MNFDEYKQTLALLADETNVKLVCVGKAVDDDPTKNGKEVCYERATNKFVLL